MAAMTDELQTTMIRRWKIMSYVGTRIEVVDNRNNRDKTIQVFERVPYNWTSALMRTRYGIAEHLSIYRAENDEPRELISAGRR
jgi:hypothetical protein